MTRLCGTIPWSHIFRDTNCWRRNVYADPLRADSDALMDIIIKNAAPEPFLFEVAGNAGGMPYCTVRGTQALVPVTFVEFPGEDNDHVGYPIPEAAKVLPWYIGGGVPGGGPTGDRSMKLLDVDNGYLYELWYARWNATLKRWEAGAGRRYDVTDTDECGTYSCNYSGLSGFAGALRYDEVYQRTAPIEHALLGGVRIVKGCIPPARHGSETGQQAGIIPAGLRLRLKSDFDLSGFDAPVAKVLVVLQRYGIIITDATAYQRLSINGTHDTRWREDWWRQGEFRKVPISAFECVA